MNLILSIFKESFLLHFFPENSSSLLKLKFTYSRIDFWFLSKFSPFPLLRGRQTALSNNNEVKLKKNMIGF